MDLVKLLSIVYPISGAIMTLFYLPQIRVILKAQSTLEEVSLLTWGTWTVCVFISFLYGLFVLKDFNVTLLSLCSSICCSAIFLTALFKRVKYKNHNALFEEVFPQTKGL